MTPEYSFLARKYAAAFMDAVGSAFDAQEYDRLEALKKYVRINRPILFFLNLPLMEDDTIDKALAILFKGLATADLFKKLTFLLIKQRRCMLLPDIMHHIGDIYKVRANAEFFMIKSAHALDKQTLEAVVQFLEKKVKKHILHDQVIDQRLIAGVRLQSDTHMWDHSIKGRFDEIKQALLM